MRRAAAAPCTRDVDHADPPRVARSPPARATKSWYAALPALVIKPDAQRDRRQLEPGVGVEQTLGRERAQHPLAVGGDAADGEHRVDAGHDQLVAPGRRVDRDPPADAHLDVVAELGAGHLGQRPA